MNRWAENRNPQDIHKISVRQILNQYQMRTFEMLFLALLCNGNPLRFLNDHDLLSGDPQLTPNGQIQPTHGQKYGSSEGKCSALSK